MMVHQCPHFFPLKAEPEARVWCRWFLWEMIPESVREREGTVRQGREKGRKRSVNEWVIAV